MSSRRNSLRSIPLNYAKMPNLGLWLDKFIADQEEKSQSKSKLVGEITNFIEPTGDWIYKDYFENTWKTNLLKSGAKCRCAKVKNRLAINLGSESVLETSIALHRLFGVPFIPGSALKGLVSHFLHQYGGKDWQKGSERHAVVFGNQDNAGFITFYDALYVPNSGFNGKPLYADVMTTHHPDYYGEKKVNNQILPPADWDSPNPVPFISATGEFLIALSGPSEWVEITFDILGFALQIEGIGAKTSSGYGRLNLEDEKGKYTDKYEIKVSGELNTVENSSSQSQTQSENERIAESLIKRINALKTHEVAGKINSFVNEWQSVEDESAKKQVATAIKQKVMEAGREKTSAEKEWFKQITLFAE